MLLVVCIFCCTTLVIFSTIISEGNIVNVYHVDFCMAIVDGYYGFNTIFYHWVQPITSNIGVTFFMITKQLIELFKYKIKISIYYFPLREFIAVKFATIKGFHQWSSLTCPNTPKGEIVI